MVIGILALQGGFALHERKFSELNIQTSRVIYPQDLQGLAGVVVPGGESSTMLKVGSDPLWAGLKEFSKSHPIWGICAGSVLMAAKISNPEQPGLGVMDISIVRNAYGSQNESFIKRLRFDFNGYFECDCIFIRAPKVVEVGKSAKILATERDNPVLIEQEHHLVTTFHPELSENLEFHQLFLKKCQNY